jgi:hypothetical protein
MKNIIKSSVVILLVVLINSCERCATPPTITTEIKNITENSATVEGIFTFQCDNTYNGRIAVAWDTILTHTEKRQWAIINNSSTGNFTYIITGLKENTTYYAWVWVAYQLKKPPILTPDNGEAWDSMKTFKTLSINQK